MGVAPDHDEFLKMTVFFFCRSEKIFLPECPDILWFL